MIDNDRAQAVEQFQELHPINTKGCSWGQSDRDQIPWQRKALTRENRWFSTQVILRGLFIGRNFLFAQKINVANLLKAAKAAWLDNCFGHPEVTMPSEIDTTDQAPMNCPIAIDEEDVLSVLALLVLPIPYLWKLQMQRANKIAITVIFVLERLYLYVLSVMCVN